MTYSPEHVANGAIPSHHFVAVPDERGGYRTISQTTTIHEARTVARRYAPDFAFIRSVPMGQDLLGNFFWVQSNWEGRVLCWGYGVNGAIATVEDREAEMRDWLGDSEQVVAEARDEEVNASIDERKTGGRAW